MDLRIMSYHGTNPTLSGLQKANVFRVEKYRPVFLDDTVGNTETIERLKIIAKDGNMPHVIISGMPGIGKTTSVLCLARQLLGDSYKEAVLELNASDERGMLDSKTKLALANKFKVSMSSEIESRASRKRRSLSPKVDKS
jgi:replication-associated recombination protein RarA